METSPRASHFNSETSFGHELDGPYSVSALLLHIVISEFFSYDSCTKREAVYAQKTKIILNQDVHEMNSCPPSLPFSWTCFFLVQNHAGNLNMGHYTAMCHDTMTQTWHCFDDSAVKAVQDSLVQSPDAYMLLYSRKPFQKPQIHGLWSGGQTQGARASTSFVSWCFFKRCVLICRSGTTAPNKCKDPALTPVTVSCRTFGPLTSQQPVRHKRTN